MSPVLPQPMIRRWMRFENWAFDWIGRGERYLRRVPGTVRYVPASFERLFFRIAVGALSAMLLLAAIPSRSFRMRALLLLLLCVFLLVMGVSYRDALPRKRR